jgi:hypothetical protein
MGSKLILKREEAALGFLTKEFAAIGQGKGGLRAITGLQKTWNIALVSFFALKRFRVIV